MDSQRARVRGAFQEVPRELFVPDFVADRGVAAVYRDEAILTKVDPSSYLRGICSSRWPGYRWPRSR